MTAKANTGSKPKIIFLAVSELIPYARNTRTHSETQVSEIAGSIREFGFTNPVLIDQDNEIIAGHGRVLAARKLSIDQVPCIQLKHLTDTQRRAYSIADNKLALNASWDSDLLSLEIKDITEAGFNADMLGFDADELAAILADDAAAFSPEDFSEYDENINTEHECPKCGYTWSGVQRPLKKCELPDNAVEWFRFGEFAGWIIE